MNPDEKKERLRSLMREHSVTPGQVAQLINVNTGSVRNWLCGNQPIPDYRMDQLAFKLMTREAA